MTIEVKETIVTAIERHATNKPLGKGDPVGLVLRGVNPEDVQRGDVIIGKCPRCDSPAHIWNGTVCQRCEYGKQIVAEKAA